MYAQVPVLSLLPSLDGSKQNTQIPAEHKVNRAMLINVAPDCEALLRMAANICRRDQAISQITCWLLIPICTTIFSAHATITQSLIVS